MTKNQKNILGFVVILVSFLLATLLFRNWDAVKAFFFK